ncbi:hypothetical protein K7X08_028653 [Anisodus acutangulus]|uniref:Dynamin N-terminal domain-containing protein n=1 Tax=Anisodus acutangulus TaxID=402998 RepID=A0A9Q1R7I2_9SOLA|nr:hypothetical protein K7X08_028653 [Anisodus acutangulus]
MVTTSERNLCECKLGELELLKSLNFTCKYLLAGSNWRFKQTSPSFQIVTCIPCFASQSSGKSSVFERIVGRYFLPRGSGIVARRPEGWVC